ncbi:NXPE family member 3-like isoform X2 [Misgurnus anguillicaudatus]|uniref:NXPE family member 3-like isoform X2 n=1 Tax=Misgurnus anguillicaudatus TaxID=75329 RepID=UPI003CCF6E4D
MATCTARTSQWLPVVCKFLDYGQGNQIQLPMPRPHLQTKHIKTNASYTISVLDMGISKEEWDRLQKALDWPSPDQEITQLEQSTSPVKTTFTIVGLKETYKVGEKIHIIITARDHNNNLKLYGGDFFQAKLFNLNLKAGVYGKVVDHRNGTYTVDLLLPWEGQAQVSVRLMHSSEVIKFIKKYWESSFARSHYYGYFEGPGPDGVMISEKVECNLKWGPAGSWIKDSCCCEYKDVKTGTVWQCERPKQLSCDYWVYHERGEIQSPLTPFEKQLILRNLTNVGIPGDTQIINVLPNTSGIEGYPRILLGPLSGNDPRRLTERLFVHTDACLPILRIFSGTRGLCEWGIVQTRHQSSGTTEKCRSDLPTPVPAGFYLKDVWKSFVCNTQSFSPPQMINCLKNKIIYLMGDSTTRQWFEFFQTNLPGLTTIHLHVDSQNGPLMAVELTNNIIIHWRPHGLPLQFRKMPAADLHYISNEIDSITGGPHVVVVFTIFAHLVVHPITFYVHKVATIRQAVVALLKRAPTTTVIIKSGNTGLTKNELGNDWHRMQLNTVMREMFSDVKGVVYLDVWQMTSCHYTTEDIHPANVVISNEIDMLLSYICPS